MVPPISLITIHLLFAKVTVTRLVPTVGTVLDVSSTCLFWSFFRNKVLPDPVGPRHKHVAFPGNQKTLNEYNINLGKCKKTKKSYYL